MSKFNKPRVRAAAGRGPIQTDTVPTGYTPEGRLGYAHDAKSELFLLAVGNLVNQNTFYERAQDRDDRYSALVHEVALTDPAWLAAFLSWLRTDGNLRSASLVGALEAAYAMTRNGMHGSRKLVSSVLQRADEPGEAIAFWLAKYGRKIPMPVKRGVADAAINLYTEYALLKYDTASHGVRFGDVIELTHPGDGKAAQHLKGDWQGDLFKLALERRHNRGNEVPASLSMIQTNVELRNASTAALLNPETLRAAGMTWEDVLSRAGSNVDKRMLWEALIPTMGYMALLRNLRNFDEAGVRDEVADGVAARLADPEQVARSKQFPFRFYSAFKAVQSLRWSHALEKALSASLSNVPALGGRTLVLVDQSPSMWSMFYGTGRDEHKGIENHDLAALFGSAIALRAMDATLVGYGHRSYRVPVPRGGSVLKLMTAFHEESGTDAYGAAHDYYGGHDRIVVVTDGENNGRFRSYEQAGIPASVPIYTWNIGGLKLRQEPGARNRHTFAGLTDHAFRMIPLLEAGRDGHWPWESGTVA